MYNFQRFQFCTAYQECISTLQRNTSVAHCIQTENFLERYFIGHGLRHGSSFTLRSQASLSGSLTTEVRQPKLSNSLTPSSARFCLYKFLKLYVIRLYIRVIRKITQLRRRELLFAFGFQYKRGCNAAPQRNLALNRLLTTSIYLSRISMF